MPTDAVNFYEGSLGSTAHAAFSSLACLVSLVLWVTATAICMMAHSRDLEG